MSWFADLAGKAEHLLNNLDEQTGAALRNHNVVKSKRTGHEKQDHTVLPQEQPWAQKKRNTSRNTTKKVSIAVETKSSNFAPVRKGSPTSHITMRQSRSPVRDIQEYTSHSSKKKSPTRKPNTQYSLNNCPRTLVGDIRSNGLEENFNCKQRRYSMPADLELLSNHDLTYKMQNLEVENAMLKNELNVMNREVSELLDRLRRTEDGNVIINGSSKELSNTQAKLDNSEKQNQQTELETEVQNKLLEELKYRINELTNVDSEYRDRNDTLEAQLNELKERNEELEEKMKQLSEKENAKNTAQIKLETELRHAQSVNGELQSDLQKSTEECLRLEKDWEAYKLRVKGMLFAKDNEIKTLKQGASATEDTKLMMEQLEKLKEERDELVHAVSTVRSEYEDVKQYMEQLETKHVGAERVVTALREALKEERAAKNRTEGQYLALSKELKSLQLETGQTIACLRTALRDKESEIANLRSTASSIQTTDTSALNVADYDVTQNSVDSDRIHYLTEMLVQKQGKIDSLLVDNNMLRIQLEKLESKYKTELMANRAIQNHVVNVQDSERRARNAISLSGLALRIGVMMKRYPLFRMFMVIYMICLHLWVMTVLFTSTPDGHFSSHIKS